MTGGSNTSTKKPKMSDSERTALMAKMDADLEAHFAELERKAAERGPRGKDPDGWTEENWEEEMQKHPFFNQGWKEGEDLPPLMQGLQDLKYSPDENTPEELAKNYKEDGNFNFKCKKYRFATASYTEGLKVKCGVPELETALLTNRAAAQFHVGNYRSSLLDCRAALALTPTHLKAITRAAQCEAKLNRFSEAALWCDRGLEVEKTEQLSEMRADFAAKAKQVERDARKRAAKEKKLKEETNALLDAVKRKGIEVQGGLTMETLEPLHPAAVQRRVRLEDGRLIWPVLFLYPEKGETDFIEEFREEEQFQQHLEVMLGEEAERPGWDLEGRFIPSNIQLYFEDKSQELVQVKLEATLGKAVCKRGFLLKGGTPAFIVLVKNADFTHDFLSKYTIRK